MSNKNSCIDARQELAELVKRKAEIGVSKKLRKEFSRFNFFYWLFKNSGNVSQFGKTNICIRRFVFGGHSALWQHYPGLGQISVK